MVSNLVEVKVVKNSIKVSTGGSVESLRDLLISSFGQHSNQH